MQNREKGENIGYENFRVGYISPPDYLFHNYQVRFPKFKKSFMKEPFQIIVLYLKHAAMAELLWHAPSAIQSSRTF